MAWSPNIEFGEWLPDQPRVSAPALRDARGLFPRERGYESWPTAVSAGRGSLDARCRGAFSGRTADGQNFVVAGTLDKLFLATAGLLTDETGASGPYAAERWDFALFGNQLVAVDGVDAPQAFEIGVSVNFADLHADAPAARHCAVVRDFLVMGNLVGRGAHAAIYGTREDGIHWSAIGDPTDWPTAGTNAAAAVQSDWQPLVDHGGAVTDVVGGQDFGLVMKERSLWRMDYEGGDTFFRLVPIESARGCKVPGSAIRVGVRTFYISDIGLCYTEGGGAVPFGNERVDRWLHGVIDHEAYEYLTTFVHPHRPIIGWGFRSAGYSADGADYVLVYNYAVNRFAYQVLPHEALLTAREGGASLDAAPYATMDMDDPLDLGATNIDSITGGSEDQFAIFGTDHELKTMTGSGAGQYARIETGDFELAPGRNALVQKVRLLYEGAVSAYLARLLYRFRINDNQETAVFGLENSQGRVAGRAPGRYHALDLRLFGEVDRIYGAAAEFRTAGMR